MYAKPHLYRCGNGHLMICRNFKGQGWPPKRMKCEQTMSLWLPERGRVELPCTGDLIRRGWRERDFVLRHESAMIAS